MPARIVLPGSRLEEFRALFFSRDELIAIRKEFFDAGEGWRGKLKGAFELGQHSLIKDHAFTEILTQQLAKIGITGARLRGALSPPEEYVQEVSLSAQFEVASFFMKVFMDHNKEGVVILLKCTQTSNETLVDVKFFWSRGFEIASCLIMALMLGACIVPGVMYIIFINRYKAISVQVETAVAEALRQRLAVSTTPQAPIQEG